MKKKIKNQKVVYSNGLRLTFDPNLKPSPTTGDGLVARKLAAANEHLSKIKNLDEILKRYANDPSHK
jgi:hypothetical protein